MSSTKKLGSNLLYSSASIYTEYFLGLIVSIVLARSLGPDEYGIYAFVIWLTALSIILINGGVAVSAIKFTSELLGRGETAKIPKVEQYHSRIQIMLALTVAAAVALLNWFAPRLLMDEEHPFLLWLIIPGILIKSYHMFLIAIIKGRQEFRLLALIAAITAPLNILFVTIAYFYSPTVLGYLLAFICTSAVYLVASYLSLTATRSQIKGPTPEDINLELKARIATFLKYSTAIIVFAYIVFGQSELLFLKVLANSSDLAFFSIGFVLARSASALIPGVYNNILLPRISYAIAENSQVATTAVLTATRHMFLLSLLAAVPLAIFSVEIVQLLYGEAYKAAYLPTFVFALTSVFSSLRDTTNAYLVSTDQQPLILRIVVILCCSTLILDYFLILDFGLVGAVMAYAVIEAMAATVFSFFAFRQLGQRPDLEKMLRALIAAALSGCIAYSLVFALSVPGGFILGGMICPVLFLLFLFLLDAFDAADYRITYRIFAARSDLASRYVTRALIGRLVSQPRKLQRRG